MEWMNFTMLETILEVNKEELKLFVGNILRIENIGRNEIEN